MITKASIKKYLKNHASELNIIVDDDNIYNTFGDQLCTIDEYVHKFRLRIGQSFKSIYYNHATLENILECNKCGTVIFTTEDESYDPNLKCPTCTDYKPHFSYYTKEQIESNKDMKNTINHYLNMSKFEKEAYEYEKKHGKPYWMICKNKFYTKNHMYKTELKCDDVRKSWFKGLHLAITILKKMDIEDEEYSFENHVIIPLSFKQIYVNWIYPHLGICHKDFRSKWYIGKAREEREKERK